MGLVYFSPVQIQYVLYWNPRELFIFGQGQQQIDSLHIFTKTVRNLQMGKVKIE